MSRAYDDMVADHMAEGWRVEQETSTHNLLAKSDPTKHWAHNILTLVTSGIYGGSSTALCWRSGASSSAAF